MKPNRKEQKLKELRRLDLERRELHQKKYRSELLVPLEKPIRHGWKKYFVLREDIARRSDAKVFREILGKVNHVILSRNPKFQYKSGKKWEDIPHMPMHIDAEKWDLPDHYKKYFTHCKGCKGGHWHLTASDAFRRYGGWPYSHTKPAYHFAYPFYFSTRIKPHFITHVRAHDGDLESRLKEIDNKLDHHWADLIKIWGGRYPWRDTFRTQLLEHELDKLAQEELNNVDL